jgi:hypothetical protein
MEGEHNTNTPTDNTSPIKTKKTRAPNKHKKKKRIRADQRKNLVKVTKALLDNPLLSQRDLAKKA